MTDFADPAFHEKYLLPFYEHFLRGVENGFEDRPNIEYASRSRTATRR